MHWDNSSNNNKDTITIDYNFYELLLKKAKELDSLKGEPEFFCQDECSLECNDDDDDDEGDIEPPDPLEPEFQPYCPRCNRTLDFDESECSCWESEV